MVDQVECDHCYIPMAQLGRFNFPTARPERKGPEAHERVLIPGRDIIMMHCQKCGRVQLFDAMTLERAKGLS